MVGSRIFVDIHFQRDRLIEIHECHFDSAGSRTDGRHDVVKRPINLCFPDVFRRLPELDDVFVRRF